VAKLRVLVVDDDDVVRTQLAGLLSAAQHLVHQLPSAIGVTRAVMQHHIDVVAIDIMMPSLRGDTLAQLLRQNPKLKNLGVVLISSRPVEELEKLAAEVSADAVVAKAELGHKFVGAVEQAARLRAREASRAKPT
jgi:two-component system phosphate regulon response regulator PhoB